MALLKVISGDLAGESFPIGSGRFRVGRADGNDLCLREGSISSSHCEIGLDAAGNLFVKDLGSTNGTFIEGQQVREALVVPGQRLRLGNLEMVFDSPGQRAPASVETIALNLPPPPTAAMPVRVTGVAVAVAPMAAVVASEDDCPNHPGVAAVALCSRCGARSCGSCTRQQKSGRKILHFCGACSGQCKTLVDVAKESAIESGRTKTFGQALGRSIVYPFRGNGIILLSCGTLFFGFLDWLPKFGIAGLAVNVILWGYIFAFMQRIVVTSSVGEDEPPGFPEVSDIQSDIVTPFFQLFITGAVSLGPGIAAFIFLGPLPGLLVLFLGMIYYPMALLGVAMSDSYAALNPVLVMSSILKVLGHYIVACLAFGFLIGFRLFAQDLIYQIEIPVLPQIIFWFVFLTILIIEMRILGMLYYLNKRKLGWGL